MRTQILNVRNMMAVGLLSVLFLFAACKKNHHEVVQPDVAGLMVFNLVTDQPAVGVSLSRNVIGAPLPYLHFTGGYVRIYPGTRSADAFAAGSSNTIATATHTYVPNKYYSLFVIGQDDDYQNVIVNDGLDTLNATDGKAYVRYINAVPTDNSLSVDFANDTADLYSGNAEYGKVSPFMALDSGAVKISVNNGKSLDIHRTIMLKNRKAYTILLSGNSETETPSDTVQIKYIENGTLTLDSTSTDLNEGTK